MTDTQDSIHKYLLDGPNGRETVANANSVLGRQLPSSIALHRRLQFGRFFPETCLLSNLDLTSPQDESNIKEPWLMAFIDRSCRPETEAWLCSSWETSSTLSAEAIAAIDNLVLNLCRTAKALPIPPSIHAEVLANGTAEHAVDTIGLGRDDYGGHASNPAIMLFGAVHERSVHPLERLGLVSKQAKTSIVPNHSFFWDVAKLPAIKDLPEGLRWGEVKREHFPLVKSRTLIPRQDRTLAALPALGIFPKDEDVPIAWAFVGLDSSVTSLHVESEWRGKGLAKTLTAKLLREKMDGFTEPGGKKLGLGYVLVGNQASEGMCKSLGGRSDWLSYWAWVDLSKV